jgi:hypothetical protein
MSVTHAIAENNSSVFADIVVTFEAPNWLLAHPDVRVELSTTERHHVKNADSSYDFAVEWVYAKGCKSCQNLRSECSCESPVITETWVYDRKRGLKASMIHKMGFDKECAPPGSTFVEKPKSVKTNTGKQSVQKTAQVSTSSLRVADVLDLLSGSTDHEEGDGSREKPVQNDQTLPPVPQPLLAHLNENRTLYAAYLTYPLKKLDTVLNVWTKMKRVLDIRPINNAHTDLGSLSCKISFPRPRDVRILEDYPAALKSAMRTDSHGEILPMVSCGDVRLALQLHFDHGFPLDGPPWDDTLVEKLKRESANGL